MICKKHHENIFIKTVHDFYFWWQRFISFTIVNIQNIIEYNSQWQRYPLKHETL